MIPYLLESNLCIISFALFYYLALHGKSFYKWNRYYILISLLLSLLIPLIHIPLEEVIYVQQGQFNNTTNANETTGYTLTWQHCLLAIYFIGLISGLYVFFKEVFQIRKLISLAELEAQPNYVLAKIQGAFPLCSFFNYIIVEKDQPISEYELNHELGHIQQKHSYDKVFMEIVKAIFWFNPGLYFLRSQLHANHEYLADETVVHKYGKNTYLDFLVKSVLNQQHSLSTVNPFHSLIKNRLHMLHNKKESTKSVFFMLIPVMFCLSFFIACEKTTKIAPVNETTEFQNLELNELGEIVVTDTIVIFNDKTLEEEVRIVKNYLSPEEYQELSIGNGRIHENHSDDLITVTDTIVIYNADTGQESTRFVKSEFTLKEYLKRERKLKEQTDKWNKKKKELEGSEKFERIQELLDSE